LHYLTVAAPGWVFIPPNYRSIINCNYQDYTLIDSTKVGFSQSSVSPGGHKIMQSGHKKNLVGETRKWNEMNVTNTKVAYCVFMIN
jgi:hypothetical protein